MPIMCKNINEGERDREGNKKNEDGLTTPGYQK